MADESTKTRRGARPAGGGLDWLTLGQAAEYLGVAQSTIRKWSDTGRLPAFYTPGGHRRFRRSDIDAFLSNSRGTSATPFRSGPVILIVDDDARLRVWEMVRRVRERHGVDSIPVIMFSGKVDERTAETATERGAQAFFGKPFDPQQLIQSTKQLLRA